jgi:hypothetical protein
VTLASRASTVAAGLRPASCGGPGPNRPSGLVCACGCAAVQSGPFYIGSLCLARYARRPDGDKGKEIVSASLPCWAGGPQETLEAL